MSVIVDSPFALAAYRQTQGMLIDRGGANSNCRKSVRVDRIAIDWLCEPTKLVFVVTPFLGDITRFFETGHVFSNLSASRGRSFCDSSNRLLGSQGAVIDAISDHVGKNRAQQDVTWTSDCLTFLPVSCNNLFNSLHLYESVSLYSNVDNTRCLGIVSSVFLLVFLLASLKSGSLKRSKNDIIPCHLNKSLHISYRYHCFYYIFHI